MAEDVPIEPTDWWANVLGAMRTITLQDLMSMEGALDKNDSWKDISLLMALADNHHFLQHAYHQRQDGRLHVEFVTDPQ